jgi:hypothetical protein
LKLPNEFLFRVTSATPHLFVAFCLTFVSVLSGSVRDGRGRFRERVVWSEFFEARLQTGFAVEEELSGNAFEVALLELGVDLLNFSGEVSKLIVVVLEITLLNGFEVNSGVEVDLVLVLMGPFPGSVETDADLLDNVAERGVWGAELDELLDEGVGVHKSVES